MDPSRIALELARAAADLARRDPSPENLIAARTAISIAGEYRWDMAGVAANGHGYNPYRAGNGQFGAGAHKERPKVGRAPSAARLALASARSAAEVARKNPTAENKAAARKAVAEAGAAVGRKPSKKLAAASSEKQAKAREASDHAHQASAKAYASGDASDHRAAVLAHERAGKAQREAGNHTAATDHDLNADSHLRQTKTIDSLKNEPEPRDLGAERLQKAERSAPSPNGHLIDAIGNGGLRDDRGNVVGLNPEAQHAVREHFAMIAEESGAARHGGQESHSLVSRSVDEMGAASGLHYSLTGRIELNEATMRHLGQHAGDDAYDHNRTMQDFKEFDGHGGRGIVAYNVMMHETFHGYGPYFQFSDHDTGDAARYQFVNEMSTEMAARHVTAKIHGFEAHRFQGGGYDDVMREAVGHVAEVTGVSRERAFAAVSEASLSLKRQGHAMTPDQAISHMADHATKSLGAPEASLELQGRWGGLAHEMNQRYPWP